MTDADLDRALTAADPVAGTNFDALDFEAAEHELMEEIVASNDAEVAVGSERVRRIPRFAFGAGLALAATVVAFLVLASTGGDNEPGGGVAYAAEAIEVAEANRRLLVTEEGWSVYYASFQGPGDGEVSFQDERGIYEEGGQSLDMVWYSDARDIEMRSRPTGEPIEIAGEPGYFYKAYRGSPGEGFNFIAVLPGKRAHGGANLELGHTDTLIDGFASNTREFRERLQSIVAVDVDTWLAAMPPSVVQPVDQEVKVEELLEGVPLPEGFDRSVIAPSGQPQDEFQFAFYVLSGAYCGWLDEWWFAEKAGEEEVAVAAIMQLKAAEFWPAVQAQAETGSLDQDFRQYANTVADGDGDKQVYDQMMNCIEY